MTNTILQIFAGTWHHQNYDTDEIIDRLRTVLAIHPVEKVIIGWCLDPFFYRPIISFLHAQNIRALLWLPVFSETDRLYPVDASEDLWGAPIRKPDIPDGEGFLFSCPSSEKNLANTKRIYETYFSSCEFDGVFLDRIRTQSFAGGIPSILGCCCKRCRRIYEKYGVSIGEVREHYENRKDHFFDADLLEEKGKIRFTDPSANAFFGAKAGIITDSVHHLCDYFHEKNLAVGLDLFAPLISPFVGQDYGQIAARADFIKPMLYRKTEAPAGLYYEYDLIKRCIPEATGFPMIEDTDAFFAGQIQAILSVNCQKYPGIEVNYDANIVKTDPDSIAKNVKQISSYAVDGITLAWDIMSAPETHIDAAFTFA